MALPDDALLRFLADRTRDVYWVTDEHGVLRYIAPQAQHLLGSEPDALLGRPLQTLLYEPDAAEAAALRDSFKDAGTCRLMYRLKRTAGDPVWVEATEHRTSSGVTGVWRDATERRRVEVAFEHQAYHDDLTQLPNRRLFDDRLTIALAHGHRSGARAAVLLIDVDRLSAINNTLGHAAGDAVLRATASRLQSRLRATDTLARVGGDEFAVAITNLRQEEDAVRLAQGLMRQFSEPLIALGQELYVSVSVGIAIFPHPTFSWVFSFTFLKIVARNVIATSPRSCAAPGTSSCAKPSSTFSSTASWASV